MASVAQTIALEAWNSLPLRAPGEGGYFWQDLV